MKFKKYQNFAKGIFLTMTVNAGIYKYIYVCLAVHSSVQHFSQEWVIVLNSIFFKMLHILNIYKLTESFFPQKLIFPQIWIKKAQNGPKTRFFWIL